VEAGLAVVAASADLAAAAAAVVGPVAAGK
jgi:hypothetical protein